MATDTEVILPTDRNSTAIQTMAIDTSVNSRLTAGSASSNSALPAGMAAGDVIRMACGVDCFFVWGYGSAPTADANDCLFTSGVEIMRVPARATHIAVIRVGADDGAFTITKCA